MFAFKLFLDLSDAAQIFSARCVNSPANNIAFCLI